MRHLIRWVVASGRLERRVGPGATLCAMGRREEAGLWTQ
jgi:hypothetical protein